MKYTQIASDAFQKLQLNAGMLLSDFNPETGALKEDDILAATGGGVSFEATPTYIDFGDDIDNVPANTMELKQLDYYDVKISGTAKTADRPFAKRVIAAADINGNKVMPRSVLKQDDFDDIWWVGDYSDVTTGDDAGFMAIHMKNTLSTGGFKIQSNDKGKGDFAFEFTAHYSINDIDTVPFEIYIKEGTEGTTDVTLSALSIGELELTPEFLATVTEYTATTANESDAITATANVGGATVAIVNGTTAVENGHDAAWNVGENVVTVTVTNSGLSKTYTVTVTRSEQVEEG
ncbi:MAG: cadherin-like beta sandwich domain-containing protein [Eggerthellaceae bacterium]|nr:cadherin-like beta sandwich domain-containing protein [Eggerthellaceae bacterium]